MLDRNSAQPLYAQFEQIMKQKIDNEEWTTNSVIPSENELSRIYGISRMTVRGVLNRLVDAGMLYRVPGKGTFVAEPKIVSKPLSQMGIRQQLEEMGYETITKLLEVRQVPASSKLARIIGVERGEPLFRVTRSRYVKGEPFSIHTSHIPVHFCPDLDQRDLEGTQLCEILENEYQYEIVKRVETLESVTAGAEEAAILRVKEGFPLLRFENTVYLSETTPVEYSEVLFRGDKIKLKLTYSKSLSMI